MRKFEVMKRKREIRKEIKDSKRDKERKKGTYMIHGLLTQIMPKKSIVPSLGLYFMYPSLNFPASNTIYHTADPKNKHNKQLITNDGLIK